MTEPSLAAAIGVHAAAHAAAAPKPSEEPAGRRQLFNPDGSAVPDVVAYHHRPEDLGDITNMDVPEYDGSGGGFFGEDGLTFGDFLDIVNPLQHIPVISTVYRAITGDEISPGARMAGGALYGGPIGLAAATVNTVVEEATGRDVGETVMAAFTGAATDPAPATLVAAAPEPGASQKPVAVAVADADPATIGVAQLPPGLLPARANAGPLRPSAPLPFGGLGTMPNVPGQAGARDPAAAILQARAAVPQAGPVPGLGNQVRAQRIGQAPMPAISPVLADKLTALAAQSAAGEPAPATGDKPRQADAGVVPPAFVPQRMLDTLERYERLKQADRTAG